MAYDDDVIYTTGGKRRRTGSSSNAANGAGSGGSSGGSSGSGSGSGSGASSSENKAANRYMKQGDNLQAQADALRLALNTTLRKGLKVKLGNVRRNSRFQDSELMRGFRQRRDSLRGAAGDNEKAAGDAVQAGRQNYARERASAVSEGALHGIGETDKLRAQAMALRNLQANDTETTRSLFDTLRSVNSALTDLNVDTRTARMNNHLQAESDREQLWNSYYGQRSELSTQLGNVYGQQADYYGMANELNGSGKKKERGAAGNMRDAFMDASREMGKAYKTKKAPERLRKWKGQGEMTTNNNLARIENAVTVDLGPTAEGATLRKWN